MLAPDALRQAWQWMRRHAAALEGDPQLCGCQQAHHRLSGAWCVFRRLRQGSMRRAWQWRRLSGLHAATCAARRTAQTGGHTHSACARFTVCCIMLLSRHCFQQKRTRAASACRARVARGESDCCMLDKRVRLPR